MGEYIPKRPSTVPPGAQQERDDMTWVTGVRIEAETIVGALRTNARRMPHQCAMRRREGSRWLSISWADYERAVQEVTSGLDEFGIEPGETVGIFSNNRAEWHEADLGTLAAGCVTVPLYQTSSAEQVAYLLGHAGARLCFVESHELAARVLEVRDQLPKLDRIVIFDNDDRLGDPFVVGFQQLRSIGAARLERDPDTFVRRADALRPDDLATLVYTSGTTGPPKAAMVSHANITWTIASAASLMEIRPHERLLSFLPLSHVAERMISDFAAIAVGAETWFARSMSTVAEDIRDCRPTVFFAVPRVWEKLQEAVSAKLHTLHGVKRGAVDEYVKLGARVVDERQARRPVAAWRRWPYEVLDASVGSKLRHEIGLDEAHIMISAAAPIHPDLLRWFHAVGLPITELYGQTETCGPTTCNPQDANRIGTVGRALPGVQVRIANDGEILVKGGNVCLGYLDDPAATAELIDADGWMHSGDVGRLDADGYLTVTGRKKDLIITAAGQNIAPQEIESDLRLHYLVAEAVVVGEGRRYLTALLTLDGDALADWAERHHKVADREALADDPDLREELEEHVAVVNGKRSRVEGVRKFRVLPREFTVASGELTPTLKVKRNVVSATFADVIEAMYANV
jgi:long-chain acyl-CoA synthetase